MRHDVLQKSLDLFSQKHVMVVGDVMLDEYTFGVVTRISPEAPIPILQKTHEKYILGGAANVARNVTALGARATLVGVIGNDAHGKLVRELLAKDSIYGRGVVNDRRRPTTHKHRFVTGTSQLLRVDDEKTETVGPALEERMIRFISGALDRCDAVVFSDYAKGVFSGQIAPEVIKIAQRKKKLTVADFKPVNLKRFKGVDVASPNIFEARAMTGEHDVHKAGVMLVKALASPVTVTCGGDGIFVFPKTGGVVHIPARNIEVVDVSGPGDTVTAVLALGLASGLTLEEASYLANVAGGIEVQKMGTATVSREELRADLRGVRRVEDISEVPKLWGHEKWLENNDLYCSKLLSLKEGYQCSLHLHKIKDEMFLVTEGHVRLELGDEVLHLRKGGFVRVPPGTPHRFRGIEDSTIIEVSTHHDDADSYRLEKSRKVAS